MVQIGGNGKTKKQIKAEQPQFVVQIAEHINEYMKLIATETGIVLSWVGDPNAATKFDSKYQAKFRTRELADIPATRCFMRLT